MNYSQNNFFYKLAYLTLTFDLVTLTLGQLLHLIDINHMCKYHLYLIIGSWYIVKTRFSQNCIFDLDLWPCDLDLRSTLTSHWYQSYVQVSSISNHWFMVYCQIRLFTNVHIWPWPLTLWPWPLVNFNILTILNVSIFMWRHMDLVKAASGELSPMFTCSEVNMYFSLLCKGLLHGKI